MSLRLPQSLFTAKTDPFDAGLQTELMAEQAASLGRAGRGWRRPWRLCATPPPRIAPPP